MGRVGLWSAALGEGWLARVRSGGSAEGAAGALGVPAFVFRNRMRRDGGLRQGYREARASFDKAQDERGLPRARSVAQRATVRWSPEVGEEFLALLAETGNARQSAISLGAPNAFANRMKRDPEFRRRCRAAAAEADERWRGATSAFPPPIEYKSATPPRDGDRPRRRKPPRAPSYAKAKPLPTDAEALGGMLRPGRKRPQSRPQPVLRRNSKGRMQVSFAREGHWTEEIEADFLARLRATGNFDACARAVGFQPASVKERARKWAAFEREVAAALEEADVALTYKQVAYAHALMRRPGEAAELGIEEEEVPYDPVMAMKILGHLDARKQGRSGKGRRKGPPERTIEQACASILAKIEAIERHEQWLKERESADRGEARPGDGE